MIRIVILGGGNVAFHLSRIIERTEGLFLEQIYNRSCFSGHFDEIRAPKINSMSSICLNAHLYIICINDKSISSFSESLPSLSGLVVHTSGSVPLCGLSSKNRRGIFYPLQSLSKDKAVDFSKVPICVEAESESDLPLLFNVGNLFGSKVYEINSLQRKYLHISAVILNNFTNHLWYLSEALCKENGVPFDVLKPLLDETLQKGKSLGFFKAQTGPAVRADHKVIEEHLQLLSKSSNPSIADIYKIITTSILNLYGKN